MDEERMIREGEHSDVSSESGSTRETTTGASWKRVAVIGVVLLLAVAGVFLAVRMTRTEPELVVADKKAHGGGQPTQGTSNMQDTSKRTTTLMGSTTSEPPKTMSSMGTESETSTLETTISTVETTTTTPSMTEMPMTAQETTETTTIPLSANYTTELFKKTAVICVYGLGLDYSVTFPDYNLCDLTVYDSLYKKGQNFFDGRYGTDLLYFLNSSGSMMIRHAGLSIDFEKHRILESLLYRYEEGHRFSASRYVGDFWNDRIYHYGMIDITPHRSTPDSVLDSIRVFKEFHKLLKRYAEGKNQRTLTFFGYTPLSQEWVDLIPSILSIFTPDIFVFHGHNSLVQRKWNSSCTILPQNAIIDMPGLPISLTTAHKTLSKVAEEQHTPAWAVSVTAAGRWNRPKNAANQDDYKLLKECIRPPRNFTKFGSITEVCNNPNYVRLEDKDDRSGYAYSLQDGLIMTYDTSDMLRQKLCRQKANLTHIDYGIAVFDLECEDDSDLCPSGSYSHIKMARALAEFFESKYNTASDLTDCLRGENK